ncbi:glycosyltransferase family 4 protein [Rhodococcus coprophilus]|uniref:Glycosyltransferase n=1 Tax=Rhodococcus coprophilus TaxID=38310 RepID=A0A2X4U7W8_9NOCA|nr:glycosyltransferase family 4 protein [Rhodococcus coprophilus]MBM7459404.1 glycosyltransferase involved in cell wall biosynthesis [Rhodococcus coprophilus]SQI35957.1 glycosyltransferase [Rhodococcus coprophilus]
MTEPLLFVAHTGQRSGAEKVLLALVDHALEQGRHVIVACPDGPLADALPGSVTRLVLPPLGLQGQEGVRRLLGLASLPLRWGRAGGRIRRTRSSENARIVCNSLFALPAVAVAVAGTGQVSRTAWLVHDTLSSRRQTVVARLGRYGVGTAVAVSGATAEPVRELGFRTVIARNGVPVGEPRPDPPAAVTQRVGILASITEWKGHRVLLEAVSRIPGVHLDVAGTPFPGDEPFLDELRARASLPDLRGRVSFLGHVPPAQVLDTWDVMVSASTSPEAGPLGVLEAMARGVPVVGTDHGGTAEYLAGGAGVLVPPGDPDALAAALIRVLGDPGLRRDISAVARRRVESLHDIERTLPEMASALWQ